MGCLLNAPQKAKRSILTLQQYSKQWKQTLKIKDIVLPKPKGKSHQVFEQISKDIDRTFPNHPFFQKSQNKQLFSKILQKFALFFPVFGYTQGLNFVVAFLLTTKLNEQQTLKIMTSFLTHHDLMFIGLYEDSFPLCKLFCQLFWLLAEQYFPKGCKLMKQTGFPDQMWIFQWFITLFIYSLPLVYIPQIVNFIIKKKKLAIVRVGIGIFYHLQKYIRLNQLNQQNIIEYLQNLKDQQFCNKYLPISQVIRIAQSISSKKIGQFILKCDKHNWYQQYFSSPTKIRIKMHENFLNKLQKQRNQYYQSQEPCQSRYSRTSINILDYIQEDKRRFTKNMSLAFNQNKLIYFASINIEDEHFRSNQQKIKKQ